MASLSHVKSRRMYSWWWDSHISPKNSKWLQDNLTDMDSKVKIMIKLIEEDADSFARRAEMYYKKRPELMKLVEEFYRAYRALAERYDHATVVIRQAHRTMSEAFPNQDPSAHFDDSPANSGPGYDPPTPEMFTPASELVQTDDLQRDGMELSSSHLTDANRNGETTEVSDVVARRKGMKQSNNSDYPKFAGSKVRKGLNFHHVVAKEQSTQSDDGLCVQAQPPSKAEHVGDPEEILNLRKALAQLEAEKEAGLIQYQQTLDKLSKVDSEISRAQEDSRELSERARIAEAEVQKLKEALERVESEKDANLLEYHQCLDKISTLEKIISQAEVNAGLLSERASKAETEAQSIKDELEKVSSEKDAALNQYVQSLEKISNLENRLEFAEEDAKKLSERAEKAEIEIETLKLEISKLSEEKEAAAVQYQQCVETISSLESKLASAEEEAQQLRMEVDDGVAKLKRAEEQSLLLEMSNQSLHSELESLAQKMAVQGEELTEKEKELGRLWTCLKEERLRFVEAETAFQTLQHLHAQTQDEIRSLALDLQSRVQTLKDVEACNQGLQDEILKVKEENMGLNDLNASSAISIKNMQEEISVLMKTKGKLEQEVELRVDQRNALQQEIYWLKEELNDITTKHLSILDQVHAAGLSPESLKSSVKDLRDENSSLKETCKRERSEKEDLLIKLEILGQLVEKNSILENSLSDLRAELEAARGKIKALEELCQSLFEEKSNLLNEKFNIGSQLQCAHENLEKLSEENTVLENSLSDAHVELQTLKAKLKSMEDSFQLLTDQKSALANERDYLNRQLETSRLLLEEMEKRFAELEERYLLLEKEKASARSRIEELQISLDEEMQEHARFSQMNESQFAALQSEMHLLQEECQERKREFDQELDRAVHSDIEIFILQRCAQDLKDVNFSLLIEHEKLVETSLVSENVISELQQVNVKQQKEVKSLSHQASTLRKGLFQLLQALDPVVEDKCPDNIEHDLSYLTSILHKIEDIKRSYRETEEQNQELALEKMILVTLLQQLRFETEHLEAKKIFIEQELKIRTERSLMLHNEALRLQEMNEEMELKLRDGNHREEALMTQMADLQRNLLDVQESLQDLQGENLKILEEKSSLTVESSLLKDNNNTLEEENYTIFSEMLSMKYLSLILKTLIDDKSLELKELSEHQDELKVEYDATRDKLNSTEKKLEELEIENSRLWELLQKSKDELKIVTEIRENLSNEVEMARDLLHEEQGRAKIQELTLQSSLQKLMKEIEVWETQASLIFGQLQTSIVCQVLYEQKVHELAETCNSLEHANIAKDTDIKLLNGLVSTLDSENKDLDARLAAYGPAITSLRECISSLESKTLRRKLQGSEIEELQGVEGSDDLSQPSSSKDDDGMVTNSVSDLQDLQNRVQALENALVEMEQHVMQENSSVHSQLETALKRIEELKSENNLHRRNFKPTSEISEADITILPKDIMLDKISESASHGISRREPVKVANQDYELWETGNQDDSIGLTINKPKKTMAATPEENTEIGRHKSIKKKRGEFHASDSLEEKELGVDKLEIFQKSIGSVQEVNNRKVLQRLNSDVIKLTNLHISVQDLKRKLEITEKSRKGKAIVESDTLKGQLEEAEDTIQKLYDLNGKLMKGIDENSYSFDSKSSMDFDDSESIRRRRISEQARRLSEKIGRLQLEVQKIQFVLLKFDDEKESKGKTRVPETKRRVLLRDYLYGGLRTKTNQSRRKKAPFCGCVQPPTRD